MSRNSSAPDHREILQTSSSQSCFPAQRFHTLLDYPAILLSALVHCNDARMVFNDYLDTAEVEEVEGIVRGDVRNLNFFLIETRRTTTHSNTMPSTSPATTTRCYILELSAELRLIIWGYYLSSTDLPRWRNARHNKKAGPIEDRMPYRLPVCYNL
ncbi:hypothetical protein DOTSEDRAFT_32292 [Dothistroma septosporum NZE10]|uniref:Uncharacterized protein n=1 Tax=Dothistroma septosporum (strain NZE10 / CBS 128990) TaxID=675120 RepID=N1PY70_DOTSN|nr:hypothetical protein DOTSEDRAFT_32292 [Dothistroma septosporum NZE10]